MKVQLRERARQLRIPVLMQTSDRGMIDVERFDLEPGRPLFHGLVGDLRAADLVGLTNEEKVPTLLKLVGAETLSVRAAASMLEVERSIRTWPQLGSAVTLGGGLTADVARRVLLDQRHASGRFYFDLAQLVRDRPPASVPTRPVVSEDRIRALVGRAVLAPSGGNHQPWLWSTCGNRLEMREDVSQRMGLTDIDDLGTAVALGAAAESLVLAAHADGLEVATAVDGTEAGLKATFDLGASKTTEVHKWDHLAPFLELRRTDRRMGDPSPLSAAEIGELRTPAESDMGVTLTLVTERCQIEALAELIGQGDRLRILDPGLRREMLAELRWTPSEVEASGDGLDVETLGLSAVDRAGLELCRRSEPLELLAKWDLGSGLSRLGRRWSSASSALGLMTVEPVDRLGYFRAGRALQRMWLTATREGLALHPLTFLPYAFARVGRADGRGFAPATIRGLENIRPAYVRLLDLAGPAGEALLFRVVRSPVPAPRSARRPVRATLRFDA